MRILSHAHIKRAEAYPHWVSQAIPPRPPRQASQRCLFCSEHAIGWVPPKGATGPECGL